MFHRPKEDQNTVPGQATADKGASTVEKTEAASPARESTSSQHAAASSHAASSNTAPVSQAAPVQTGFRPQSTNTHAAKTDHHSEKDTKTMTTTPNADNKHESGEGYSRPLDIPGTAAFQRPGANGPQGPRVPGAGYVPGNYGTSVNPYGSSAAPSSSTATDPRTSSSRKLVVGEGITLSGEIESCDTLIVEGTVEAALKGASSLDIAESGVFYGTVEIDECMIAGRFEGDITVHGRLTLKASGSVTGSISYKELAVEAGATIDGKMSPLSGSGKKAEKKDSSKGAKLAGKPQGGELPFAGHATAAE